MYSYIWIIFAFCACVNSQFEKDSNEKNSVWSLSKDNTNEIDMNAAERLVQRLEWFDDQIMADLYNATERCQQDFDNYKSALQALTPWALKMADSTGKLESGIYDGNSMFEGRYPECINANSDGSNSEFDPLYCRASWIGASIPYFSGMGICIPDSCTNDDARILMDQVFARSIPERASIHCERFNDLSSDPEAIVSILILSLFGLLVFIASIYDKVTQSKVQPVHPTVEKTGEKQSSGQETHENLVLKTVEKQSTTHENLAFKTDEAQSIHENLAINKDAETNLNTNNNTESENNDKNETGGPVIKFKEPSVIPANNEELTNKTSYKVVDVEKATTIPEQNIAVKLLLCFSLYQNLPLVVSAKEPAGSYSCLNGLRVIAMFCIVYGHTFSDSISTLFENYKDVYDDSQNLAFVKVLNLELYVDTFFILSAFLMTISFLKQLKRSDGKLTWRDMALHYFNRYWRLTPSLMLVLMVYTNLLHYFVTGPFANDYEPDIDPCASEWWKTLLYVNNLFVTPGISCMGYGWYLPVDMQLFIMAPLFLYIVYRWEKIGIVGLVLGFCGGLVANIVLYERLYTEPDDAADPMNHFVDIYIKPWTRCPVYFMGMMLGYLFFKTNGKIKMPKVVVLTGWVVAFSLFFMTVYLPPLLDCDQQSRLLTCDWSIAGQVTWSTLYRPMWGVWVCWVILACITGYGGIVNSFLSWNFFVPLGRLSYLCYLIHYIIIMVYFNGQPIQPYYTHINMFYIFLANLVITFVLALIFCATISAPLMKVATVFLPSRRGKAIR